MKKTFLKYIIALCLLFGLNNIKAQNSDIYDVEKPTYIVGTNIMSNAFIQLGIAKYNYNHGSVEGYGKAFIISYDPAKQNFGFTVSTLFTVIGLAVGLDVNTYTNFKTTSIGVQPKIGINLAYGDLVYGYNISDKSLNAELGLNSKHSLTLRFYLQRGALR